MSKRIGPSFAVELAAAGIVAPRISWDEAGVKFLDDAPASQRAAVNAVIAAHNPETVVERAQTMQERIAGLEAEVARLSALIAALPGGSRQ